MIAIIAAVGENLELGLNNKLLWHLPNDLKFFKEKTTGKIIIMGYNTFLSLGRPLPNRQNIVLSRQDRTLPDNVLLFHSIEEVLGYIKDEDVFVIGGAQIYEQFLPLAHELYLTEIKANSLADAYFPNFDKTSYEKEILATNSDNDINYQHVLYKKK